MDFTIICSLIKFLFSISTFLLVITGFSLFPFIFRLTKKRFSLVSLNEEILVFIEPSRLTKLSIQNLSNINSNEILFHEFTKINENEKSCGKKNKYKSDASLVNVPKLNLKQSNLEKISGVENLHFDMNKHLSSNQLEDKMNNIFEKNIKQPSSNKNFRNCTNEEIDFTTTFSNVKSGVKKSIVANDKIFILNITIKNTLKQ